jgi:hypothetical protein
MADMSDFVAQNTLAPNAIQQANQGTQSGMDWAARKAGLDIQQQQVQNQMAQTKLYQDEFKFKVGNQMMDEYNQILPMKNGKYKNQLLQNWQDKYTQAGFPPHDSYLAAAQDESYSKDVGDVLSSMKNIGVTDPDTFKKVVSNFPMGVQQPLLIDTLKSNMEAAKMVAMMNAKNQATDQRQQTRISAGEINKSLGMAQSATSNDQNVLGAIKRLHDTADAANDGTLVDTKQLLNSLNTEKAKVEMGANKLTEGSMERQRSESIASSIAGLIQKVSNAPQSANIKGFADQITKEADVLGSQYMKDIDTHHEMLREGFSDYPGAQKALDNTFGALRKNVASKGMLGQWDGLDKYKIKPQDASQNGNDNSTSQSSTTPTIDPMMLRQAGAVKQMIDKEADPKAKAALIRVAKKKFNSDILSKVGIQ